jgi:ferredoxin
MATRNEKDTTRARANILREFLTNSDKLNRFDHKEIYEVLDLCLACKGCKSECPSNVDMAKLKMEFLQHYHDANGVPFRARLISNFTRLNGLATIAPGIYNWMINTTITSNFIKNTAGFALKTTDLANSRADLFGPELADYMKRAARNLAGIKTFGEEQPRMENRVELVSDKDEFGMPLGKLTHTFDDDAVALWNANLEVGLKIAKGAGAKEAWSARGMIPTSHLMGGTVMGAGAANSVVDSYGQSHEIPNLWVAGPSIFPTAGASNPTFTIFALSQRGAERMASQWGALTN